MCGLALVMAGACAMGVSKASANPLLPGSFWPNGNVENASASPLELNSPSMNNVPGGPGTWRRGGGDFTGGPNPGPYNFDLWDASHGTTSGTHAIVVNDDSVTGNGEWFVPDFDVDATVVTIPGGAGQMLEFNFWWKYTTFTIPPSGDPADMRVTIRGSDGTPGGFGLGPAFDFLANGTTGGAFVNADFVRQMPAGVTGIRMNIASGGGSGVGGFIAVDDISVRVVPEPTSLAFLTAGTMLLLSKRRRA